MKTYRNQQKFVKVETSTATEILMRWPHVDVSVKSSILVKLHTSVYLQMIHHIKSESTDEGKVRELNGI